MVTIKNKYLLSLISKPILQLQDAKYFIKIDIHWGFNNVHIKPRDEWKTAFHTNCGVFEPLIIIFSMTYSPAIFQTMMNNIFYDLIAKRIMIVYLDNILIFTQTLEKHHQAVWKF